MKKSAIFTLMFVLVATLLFGCAGDAPAESTSETYHRNAWGRPEDFGDPADWERPEEWDDDIAVLSALDGYDISCAYCVVNQLRWLEEKELAPHVEIATAEKYLWRYETEQWGEKEDELVHVTTPDGTDFYLWVLENDMLYAIWQDGLGNEHCVYMRIE